MTIPAFFLVLSLLSSIGPLSVHSEETPVFVLKGQDVCLEIKEHVDPKKISFVSWRFNDSESVVIYTPFSKELKGVQAKYENKLSFSKERFSLLIKNLQHADSGSYSAQVIREGAKQIHVSYSVVVQDKVDSPVLMLDSTADSCNMTVTCRTLSTSVSSTCSNTICSQVGGDRGGVMTSTAPLLIYVSKGSIICNHSNQVSWAEDTKEIKELCPLHPLGIQRKHPAFVIGSIAFVVVIVCIAICVYAYQHKKKKRTECFNSAYDSVQNPYPAQGPPVDQSDDSSLPSIYSMVQLPKPESPETMAMADNVTPLNSSIYAQVTKKDAKRI